MNKGKTPCVNLFEIAENVKCIKCGSKGAVKSYGNYFPQGLGSRVDEMSEGGKMFAEEYRNKPKMSRTAGFGGTIPHRCLNCGNTGLIDINGLECLKKAFETIKDDEI